MVDLTGLQIPKLNTPEDRAMELELLSTTFQHPRQVFLMGMGGTFDNQLMQDAFERALMNDWLRLIDIVPVNKRPGDIQITRVFHLTDAGKARLRDLRATIS
jgi:hypothetical protein